MVSSERSISVLSGYTLFQIQIEYFYQYKNQLKKKVKIIRFIFAVIFFLEIFSKFRNLFVNSHDCIEKKTHQNLSDCDQFLIKKRFEIHKKKFDS